MRFFSENDQLKLESARRAVDAPTATIAYCVYENPFARSGGIFAVAENYAGELVSQKRNVLLFSPLHTGLKTAPSEGDIKRVGACAVPFGGELVDVTIYEHIRNKVRWILLGADGFFDAEGGVGQADPYAHNDPDKLLQDSLLISSAIPLAAAALGITENVIFHVQDWQMATVALKAKLALLADVLSSAAVVLTSHNPYDCELPQGTMNLVTHRRDNGERPADTVYQCMIPLTDAPVTTVSETFAKELLTDLLQTTYFAGHLQDVFRQRGVVGVNNGLFGTLKNAFTAGATEEALRGKPDRILGEKRQKRQQMLKVLSQYTRDENPQILGSLSGEGGGPLTDLPDEIPIFMMFGRLDPRQKGFDVLTRAIERMEPGSARFVLTPIVSDVAQGYVRDLEQLAASRTGEVVVYPFRMEQGYLATMAGATYCVMPSLYEPFGGASEPYLQGTPVVARATGGLVQQVVDVREHPESGTGILFREANRGTDEWRPLLDQESPVHRMEFPLYREIVDALVDAMTQAMTIYRDDPVGYGQMLARLSGKAGEFSWSQSAEGYNRIYLQATK